MKHLFLAIVICLSTFVSAEVTLNQLTAAEIENTSYTIGKIIIDNGYLYLIAPDGEILGSDPISTVRSLVFEKSATSFDNIVNSNLRIFPTITSNVINVVGADEAVKRIFNVSGNLIMSTIENTIDVDGYPNGTYLLQVNTQIVKFIKN